MADGNQTPNADGGSGGTNEGNHPGPGGTDQRPGGSTENQGTNNPPNGGGTGTVSYDSFQKALDEKKKLAERLKTLEDEKAAQERKALEENDRYKELYESTKQDLEKVQTAYTTLDSQIKDSTKVHAVLNTLEGSVDSKYWGFIDTKSVVMDDNGNIDENSAKKVAEKFQKEHGLLISKPQTANVPPNPPKGSNGSSITMEYFREKFSDPNTTAKELKELSARLNIN